MQYKANMALLLGSNPAALLGVCVFVAALTYVTYKLLASYLHKWFEMKPIQGVPGTYPFIGNALQFKNNAGGKEACRTLLQEVATAPVMHEVFLSWFQTSFAKYRIIPRSSVIHRCLNSGLDRCRSWFCFTLRLLR